jgi:peptide/nickel transport system substrate-binding protein
VLSNASFTEVGVHVFDGLVRLDPMTSELIPGLAESWSMEEGGASWVFNLRKGAMFHKNEEFFGHRSREVTTADVAYSISRVVRDASEQIFSSTVQNRLVGAQAFRSGTATDLPGVIVLDDYTVQFKLQKSDPSFLYVLAQPTMGIIPKASAESELDHLIGSGPFRFEAKDSNLLLTRNAEYFRNDQFGNRLPYLDSLELVEARSNTDRINAFFDGTIGVVTGLELDPVRNILEQHVRSFSGKNPEYVMKRETENASYETYTVYDAGIKDIGCGFMGYRDYSQTQKTH